MCVIYNYACFTSWSLKEGQVPRTRPKSSCRYKKWWQRQVCHDSRPIHQLYSFCRGEQAIRFRCGSVMALLSPLQAVLTTVRVKSYDTGFGEETKLEFKCIPYTLSSYAPNLKHVRRPVAPH